MKEVISTSQNKQKRVVVNHRRPLELNIDDWVVLKFTKAQLRHTTCKDWQGKLTCHPKFYSKLA